MFDYEGLLTFVDSGIDWAEKRAIKAISLTEEYNAGVLSEEEYMNSMYELVDSKELDIEADDLDTKAALITTIYSVANII
jgi:hypothetical protein